MSALGWGAWWSYNETMASTESDKMGVYELGDKDKNTVYYGKGEVKTRLLVHINKKECPLTKFYRVEHMSETNAINREKQLLEDYKKAHDGKLPTYNERVG